MKNNRICIDKKVLKITILSFITIMTSLFYLFFIREINKGIKNNSEASETNSFIIGHITLDYQGIGKKIDQIGVGAEIKDQQGNWQPIDFYQAKKTFSNPQNGKTYSFALNKRFRGDKDLKEYDTYRINAYALKDGNFLRLKTYVTLCYGDIEKVGDDISTCILQPPGSINFVLTNKEKNITPIIVRQPTRQAPTISLTPIPYTAVTTTGIITGHITLDYQGIGKKIDQIGVGAEIKDQQGNWQPIRFFISTQRFENPQNGKTYSFSLNKRFSEDKGLDESTTYRINAYALRDDEFLDMKTYVTLCYGDIEKVGDDISTCVLQPPGNINFVLTNKKLTPCRYNSQCPNDYQCLIESGSETFQFGYCLKK